MLSKPLVVGWNVFVSHAIHAGSPTIVPFVPSLMYGMSVDLTLLNRTLAIVPFTSLSNYSDSASLGSDLKALLVLGPAAYESPEATQ